MLYNNIVYFFLEFYRFFWGQAKKKYKKLEKIINKNNRDCDDDFDDDDELFIIFLFSLCFCRNGRELGSE